MLLSCYKKTAKQRMARAANMSCEASSERAWLIASLVAALSACAGTAAAQDLSAPAVLTANDTAVLSAVLDGELSSITVKEGDFFKAGDVLANFNCGIPIAHADAAKADMSAISAEYQSLAKLAERGAIGLTEVAIVEARMHAAEAVFRAAQLELEGCTIRAPFDGYVSEVLASSHEFVQVSQPVLSVVSDVVPTVEIIVPSTWLTWVEIGEEATIFLEALDQRFVISVETLAPVVDPSSRTVKLYAILSEPGEDILPGMSGLVTFKER